MDKKLVLYGIIASFAILALAYQINKSANDYEKEQKSVERYVELEKLMDEIIDVCAKPDSSIPKEQCQEAALEIIQGCNALQVKPLACEDPRLYEFWQ